MLHIKACRQRVCVLEFISFKREVTLQRCAGAAPCPLGLGLPSSVVSLTVASTKTMAGGLTARKLANTTHRGFVPPAPSPWWWDCSSTATSLRLLKGCRTSFMGM